MPAERGSQSAGTRRRTDEQSDWGPKLRANERTGVREVWLVDPTGPARTEILQRHGLRLRPVTPEDGVVPSLALPGFRLRLEWLWPEGRFIPVRDAIESMLSTGKTR